VSCRLPLEPVVVLAVAGDTDLADRRNVQGVVEAAVAAAVEPVPVVVAGGHVDGCGAGVAGEVVAAGEAAHVADLTDDPGGQDWPMSRTWVSDVGDAASIWVIFVRIAASRWSTATRSRR
jgi:hypothetical protein